MAALYPHSGEGIAQYVDMDELSILLTRRPLTILSYMRKALERGTAIRVTWKPGADPLGPGLPAFHIDDLAPIFLLPKDYVEEIVRFRRDALRGKIVLNIPDSSPNRIRSS